MSPAFKTLIWTLANAGFGLLQYFILSAGNWLKFGNFTPSDVIKEGLIMFFCAAITGAVSIDYLLGKKHRRYPEVVDYILKVFPYILMAGVILVYSVLHFHANREYDYGNLATLQRIIISFAAVYCVGVKFAIFNRE